MVRSGCVVLVDSVVGNVWAAGLQHPEVSVVHLTTLALELTCKAVL